MILPLGSGHLTQTGMYRSIYIRFTQFSSGGWRTKETRRKRGQHPDCAPVVAPQLLRWMLRNCFGASHSGFNWLLDEREEWRRHSCRAAIVPHKPTWRRPSQCREDCTKHLTTFGKRKSFCALSGYHKSHYKRQRRLSSTEESCGNLNRVMLPGSGRHFAILRMLSNPEVSCVARNWWVSCSWITCVILVR